jgi:hypothetical protein
MVTMHDVNPQGEQFRFSCVTASTYLLLSFRTSNHRSSCPGVRTVFGRPAFRSAVSVTLLDSWRRLSNHPKTLASDDVDQDNVARINVTSTSSTIRVSEVMRMSQYLSCAFHNNSITSKPCSALFVLSMRHNALYRLRSTLPHLKIM